MYGIVFVCQSEKGTYVVSLGSGPIFGVRVAVI